MNEKLNGLSLDEKMRILTDEGLLADGAFGDIHEVTVFEEGQPPKKVEVKSVVVFEQGKSPVTLLSPVS